MIILIGKIIRILDKRTVIINLGKEHGVKSGAIFSIIGEAEEIIDPFTNESLGEVKVIKSRVKAVEVAEKFSIATTKWNEKQFKFLNSFLGTINDSMESNELDEGELKVEFSDIQPWKAKSEQPVRVGDVVKVEIKEELPVPIKPKPPILET